MVIISSQIRHNFVVARIVIRDRKVMIVNKNNNQSQALKLVCYLLFRYMRHLSLFMLTLC